MNLRLMNLEAGFIPHEIGFSRGGFRAAAPGGLCAI
jgi:hypothetical protein